MGAARAARLHGTYTLHWHDGSTRARGQAAGLPVRAGHYVHAVYVIDKDLIAQNNEMSNYQWNQCVRL